MTFFRLSIFRVEFRRFIRSDSGSGAEFARFFKLLVSYICTYIATECQNRSENLINRKLSIFYIETMYQLFFQLQPKNIFFGIKNIFRKKIGQKYFSVKIPKKKTEIRKNCPKIEISDFSVFSQKNNFCLFFFRKIFLIPKKHIFWLELEKMLLHSFDAEI